MIQLLIIFEINVTVKVSETKLIIIINNQLIKLFMKFPVKP